MRADGKKITLRLTKGPATQARPVNPASSGVDERHCKGAQDEGAATVGGFRFPIVMDASANRDDARDAPPTLRG